jgi:hypothetical protein
MPSIIHSKLFTTISLFVVVFLIYVASGNPEYGGDTRWSVHVAGSLLYTHDLNLDEYYSQTHYLPPNYKPKPPEVIKVGNHGYNLFPYGVSVMEVPILWSIDTFAGKNTKAALAKVDLTKKYQLASASLFMAIGVAIFFLIGMELIGDLKRSLLISLLYAFGSSAYSIGSRGLWMHGPTMLWLSVGLLGVLKARKNTNWLYLTGFAIAFSYVVRPTNAVSCLMFAAYAVYKFRWQSLKYFAGAAIVAIPFLLFNHNQFHAWLPPYYHHSEAFKNPSLVAALLGDLISPNRGLLIYTPVLLFVPLGWKILWKGNKYRDVVVLLSAIIVLHWFVIADTKEWWGGYSFGPRFFSDVAPLMFFFLLPISFSLLNRVVKVLFVLAASLSIFFNFLGANSKGTVNWNKGPGSVHSRVWKWSDMQIFRGL